MAGIVFNKERCTGCRACEGACKQENNLPVGVRWRVINMNVEGIYPDLKKIYQQSVCRHCAKPKCCAACPAGAIWKEEASGIVLVDAERCSGCRECIKACPFDAMNFDEDRQKAGKCTLCNSRIKQGLLPACVANCMGLALDLG